jgi:hypothetical protein
MCVVLMKTYLFRLGMHRQPIRVETFVIRHGGVELLCCCGVQQVRGLIYECDTKLQLLGGVMRSVCARTGLPLTWMRQAISVRPSE